MNLEEKVTVNYELPKKIIEMVEVISREENKSPVGIIENIVSQYFKETRKEIGIKNLPKGKIIKLACNEHNSKYARFAEWDNEKFEEVSEDEFKITSETLNFEFTDRARHIDNGVSVLESGIESTHRVKHKGTGDYYIIVNTKYDYGRKHKYEVTIS